jgi:hypothetical protein
VVGFTLVLLEVSSEGGRLREYMEVVEKGTVEENTRVKQQQVLNETLDQRTMLKS